MKNSNKVDRESKEMRNLFDDPKFARKAWKYVGNAILQGPAIKPVSRVNKEGDETYESEVERYSYNTLAADIKKLSDGDDTREPTELEVLMQSQIILARTNPSAAAFIRDTVGAKPVDESKVENNVNANMYAGLTDEELEMLDKYRKEHKVVEDSDDADSE